MKRQLLLETVHGSHLYGLNHADSDLDIYRVWSGKGKMRQRIDSEDVTNKSFEQFMSEAAVGVPQALEALWSPIKTTNEIDYLTIRPGINETLSRYQRTMKSFWLNGDFKHKRHALRLQLNIREYIQYGFFNPRLSAGEIEEINHAAHIEDDYPIL